MPSNNIVRDIRALIQDRLLPAVTPYWREQLWFGLQAYSLRAFQSAAGNARQVVANAHTAARKTERLFQNRALTDQLATVFDALGLVRPGSYVNCDHSDMNGLVAFVTTLTLSRTSPTA